MDRRKFLTMTAGLSALSSSSVEAVLSLEDVKSGLQTRSKGKLVDVGTDFLKEEQYHRDKYVYLANSTGIPRRNKKTKLYSDGVSQECMKNIYIPLTQSSTRENLQWKVLLLDDPELDAFTIGGGLTCVSIGLIRFCKSETELASVLAHEIGHIEHRHMIKRLMTFNVLKEFGLGLKYEEIERAAKRERAGKDTELSKMMAISLEIFFRNYRKMWELQADAFTLKAFVDHDYDLKLASSMMHTLDKLSGPKVNGTCLYNVHPEAVERIERIDAIANTLSNFRRPRGDSEAFRYLKDRLGHINV